MACLGEERFMLFGSGAAQEMHHRWIETHLPGSGVGYRNRSDELHGMAISGPRSRELLLRIARLDVSNDALRFRDVRQTHVGGVPAILSRVSFSGELGYEIYVAPQFQLKLFEAIEDAGADLGLKLYGARALMSLRLERTGASGHWITGPTSQLRNPVWTPSSTGTKISSARRPRWRNGRRVR